MHDAGRRALPHALGVGIACGADAPSVWNFGPIHRNSPDPVAPAAAWHIGSITKSITATMVMRAVEAGRLELHQRIDAWLGSTMSTAHSDWRGITLHGLLTHSAGLPGGFSRLTGLRRLRELDRELPPHEARLSVLRSHWQRPLPHRPGRFRYANLGYMLIGAILEAVDGEPWETAVFKTVTEPLGLTSAGLYAPTESGAAWGHRGVLLARRPVDPARLDSDLPKAFGPAGLIHLSMQDLTRWGQTHLTALRSGSLISRQSAGVMQTAHCRDYGYGWAILPAVKARPAQVAHDGSNLLWSSLLVLVPESSVAVALATNRFTTARLFRLAQSIISRLPMA